MSEHPSVTNTVARYFEALDAGEWDRVVGLMTSPFHLDYSSFGAGEPADLVPEDVVGAWKEMLPGFDHTHHQYGNVDVELDGDAAAVRCAVHGSHVIGDDVWLVVGRYALTLARVDGSWRLSGIRFQYRYQTGPADLPQRARARVAAAG